MTGFFGQIGDCRNRSHGHGRGRFGRRGNALVMAVTLTALLAIIGTSFVMVTRVERQGVRELETVQGAEAVVDQVLVDIGTVLANDIVDPEGNPPPAPVGALRSGAAWQKTDSYFGWNNSAWRTVSKDSWLAALEPELSPVTGEPAWRQVSDLPLYGNGAAGLEMEAPVWDWTAPAWDRDVGNRPPGALVVADADGDGIIDSIWRQPDSLQVMDGKDIFVALRIIDNCGMINVNTTWGPHGAGAPGDELGGVPDPTRFTKPLGNDRIAWFYNESLGALPTQVDIKQLLLKADKDILGHVPTETEAEEWQEALITGRLADQRPRVALADLPLDQRWVFTDDVLRFHEDPAALLMADGTPFVSWWTRLFTLDDELELRNRFLLNTLHTSWLESVPAPNIDPSLTLRPWFPVNDTERGLIGWFDLSDPEYQRKYARTAPYTDAGTAGVDQALNTGNWWYAVTGDNSVLTAAGGVSDPAHYRDLRHLLTAYSYDRTLRPGEDPALDVTLKDPGDSSRTLLGPMRSVDIERAVRGLFATDANDYRRSVMKLAYALRYAGYKDPDEAVQWVANLRDYLDGPLYGSDANNLPTKIGAGYVASGIPAKDVYGFERQPFITEVYAQLDPSAIDKDEMVTEAGVELYNPYDTYVSLSGLKIEYNGNTYPLDQDPLVPSIPPNSVLVFIKPGTGYGSTGPDKLGNLPLGQVKDLVASNFKLRAGTKEELRLLRDVGGDTIVLDAVVDTEMQDLLEEPNEGTGTQERDLQRGITQWRWARATYDFAEGTAGRGGGNVNGLANWPRIGVPGPKREPDLGPVGVQLPVADHVTLHERFPEDTSGLPMVGGWFELTRPTLLGNPTFESGSEAHETVAESIKDEVQQDPGPGTFRDRDKVEGRVRLNLADANKGRKLFEAMAFFARCDDGFDNDNSDKNNNANVDWDLSTTAKWLLPRAPASGVDPDLGADDLGETRIPGRINVNTAPLEVLRAIFPALLDPRSARVLAPGDESKHDRQLNDLADLFARVVVAERIERGAFKSLADFVDRIAKFGNVLTRTSPIPELPSETFIDGNNDEVPVPVFWYGALLGRWEQGGPYRAYNLGDPWFNYDAPAYDPSKDFRDYEERDWILGRIAQVLTVRSDTFTAYILVRVQDQANPSQFVDRRVMAIFDRSNVFLPPSFAANGENDSGDRLADTEQDKDVRDREYVVPRIVAFHDVGSVY
jgi:hypothetical protein